MSDINKLVSSTFKDPTLKQAKGLGGTSSKKPELKEGEFAVQMKEKKKELLHNLKTGRMKKFKRSQWLVTKIPPEERTLKNRPKYADGKPKVTFQQWLQIDGKKRQSSHSNTSFGWAANGKCYGWSHRAISSFYIGKLIKPDHIGNKFEYGKEVDKKYNKIMNKEGYEVADKWRKETLGNFTPYKIKTDQEAEEHAIRFAEDVS